MSILSYCFPVVFTRLRRTKMITISTFQSLIIDHTMYGDNQSVVVALCHIRFDLLEGELQLRKLGPSTLTRSINLQLSASPSQMSTRCHYE